MNRINIDLGIDLGTTNNSVAVLGKRGPVVIRNREGSEITPSAVHIHSSTEIQIGKSANERYTRDISEKANTAEMTNQDRANKWFAHAEKAIANGDFEALKSACRQLWALLPAEEQRRGYGGTSIAAKDPAYWASSV